MASKLERERGNYRTRKAEKEREAHAGLEMFVNSVWHLIALAQFYLNNVCKLVVKSPYKQITQKCVCKFVRMKPILLKQMAQHL